MSTARWTRDKKIAIAIAIAFLVITAPLWIWVASNFLGAVLSLVLEKKPSKVELAGDYRYIAKWGSASLALNPNNTFREVIKDKLGKVRVCGGSWGFQDDENSAQVNFRPFGMVWDDDHDRQVDQFSMSFFKRRLGKTYASVNNDLGEQFEKC